jgi:tight adherence protein C
MYLFILLGVAGFYAPNLWVKMKTQGRQQKITEGFPDALDLMTVCVEAGLGLDAALNQVADEIQLSNKVLSEELKLINLELRAGQSRANALRNLSLRTDLEDVNNFTTLLIQTDNFGTSIGQALRVHSDTMRTKRHHRAEEAAAKLPVKLLFPLIFFIFPSMFVVIMGPAIIQIMRILLPTLNHQ